MDKGGSGDDGDSLTVADFLAALEEEKQEHQAFFGQGVEEIIEEAPPALRLDESLRLVQSKEAPENWVLIRPAN
jgi:hypothetical protein